jgi:hypothetical protein
MTQFNPRPFIPSSNADILNAIRAEQDRDYRANVPVATQANITESMHKIMDFKARRNDFIDALVNRIGLTIARSNNWTNPLGKFKRGILTAGETIQEIQVGLLKAHEYSADREYLEKDVWGTEVPDVRSAYHTRNRQNFYKVSVNTQELTKAFLEEGGLSQFITSLMAAPTTSDNWAEYSLMAQLFREYYDNSGFFKVQIPNIAQLNSNSDDAKGALRAMRTMADTLPFISTAYNPAHMPMSATADDLELFVTPQANAALDVEGLAGLFNVDRAQVPYRQTLIRQEDMNIPGAQAILTTRDFFMVADTYYDTESIANPAGRTQNYFLHHDQIISASLFQPAILFTTEPSSPIYVNDPVVTTIGAITITDRYGNVVTTLARGEFYQVSVASSTDTGATDVPVLLSLLGENSTYSTLSQNGTLFIGADETATAVTVSVMDEAGKLTPVTDTVQLTGDIARLWPNPGVIDVTAPTITSVLPSGAKAGDTVTIVGTEFDGTTAVTVGGTEVTSFTIGSSTELTAVLPAGAAGSAPVIVTNNKGASAAAAYTRA